MVLRASYRIKERLKNDKELNQVFKEELIKRTPKIMGNSHQPEVYLFKIFNSPKKNE